MNLFDHFEAPEIIRPVQMEIGDNNVKQFSSGPLDSPLGRHFNGDSISFRFEHLFVCGGQNLFVLNHQNRSSRFLHVSCSTGSTIRKVVPTPIFVSKSSSPPCLSTSCSTTERPRPVPPFLVVKNGS